jgi:hypothetical protein
VYVGCTANKTVRVKLPKHVAENIDRFTGRISLLPKILDWWDKSDKQLFLLTGDPGTGKSMILGWLAGFGPVPNEPTAQSQLARIREAVKGVHFCQAASRNISPQAFADNMANQLTRNVRGFADALAATLNERVQILGTAHADTAEPGAKLTGNIIGRIDLGTLGDELSFDRAFTEPLKKLDGNIEPLLLLVDALDEAQTYTGVTIPDLLSRLTDLPREVRILATTRDEPRVLKFFRNTKPFDVIKDADPNKHDVQTYAEGRLAEFCAVDESKRKDFAHRLALKADGVFLYAAMVLDDLLARPADDLPELGSYSLPNGLSGLYHDFLKRELGKDDQRWFDLYEPLLGLIAVAQGEGLTATQLTGLVGRDIRSALRACNQYLSGDLPDGPFRPFHKSFADYLLEDDENTDFRIDGTAMHKRVADHYWSHNVDWSNCDEYGLKNLATHLWSSNRIDDLVALISHSWMRVRYERAGFTYSQFQADIDLAWRAVSAESRPQLEHLIHLRAAALAVQEQVSNYEDADLEILVGLKRSEEALTHARLRNTPQKRFEGLLRIYNALDSSQDSWMEIPLYNDARVAANAISDPLARVRALCSLARSLSRNDQSRPADVFDDVEHCIHGIQDMSNQAIAKREFVSALVKWARLHDANKITASIDDDVQRAFAFESIAINLADSGQFREAQRLAGLIMSTSSRSRSAIQRTHVKTLAGIGRALATTCDPRSTTAMFEKARQAAISIEDLYMRHEALQGLAAALTHSKRFSEAQRVATEIHDWRKSRVLMELAVTLARNAEFESAELLVDDIPDVEWQSFALRDIAQELTSAGRNDEARSIEQRLQESTIRASTLCGIAAALFQKGDERGRQVLQEATRLCGAIKKTSERTSILRRVVNILLQAQDLEQARIVFEQVRDLAAAERDDEQFCVALREMSIALASVQDKHADDMIHDVRAIIKTLTDSSKREEKREFATGLSSVGRFDDAWQVLESDKNDIQREGAWYELATSLARVDDSRADAAFEQAELAIREIINEEARNEALGKLAVILIKEGRFEMAVGVIDLIKPGRHYNEAIIRLAVAIYPNNPAKAREHFKLVERMAIKAWDDYSRDEALVGLVSGLARSGEFDDALRVSSIIITGGSRVAALCHLAEQLVLAGDPQGQSLFSEGLQVATSGAVGDAWVEANDLRREAARLSREGEPNAGALWIRAQEVAGSAWTDWIWGESQYRAEGILHLAIALTRTKDSRADSTFNLAHQVALEIPYENARDQTLRELVNGLIEVDRLETATTILSDIRGDSERLSVVRNLITAFTTAGQIDSALRLARSIPSEYYRREIMRDIAAEFARVNQMTEALQVLEETSLDGFIGALGMIQAAWTAARPDEVLASMRAVTSVAAWVRSDWNKVHTTLMT